MNDDRCKCGASLLNLGDSPFCEYCGETMCFSCEKKHSKDQCKIEQEFKKKI